MEAGGEASLPENVTVPDFRMWMTCSRLEASECTCLMLSTICTVMKVADAVDDRHLGAWIQLASDSLIGQVHAHADLRRLKKTKCLAFSATCFQTQISAALAALPAHLQHQVLAIAVARKPAHKDHDPPIHTLLELLPPHLHKEIIQAAVSPEKSLTVQMPKYSPRYLHALQALASAPHMVNTMEIYHHFDDSPFPAESVMMAQQVCEVLKGLSCLSSISIGPPCTTNDAIQQLIPGLCSLTGLKQFDFSEEHYPIPAECMPVIGNVLQCMPGLQFLDVAFEHQQDTATKQLKKRQRDEDVPLRYRESVASFLSPLTALTCLSITVQAAAGDAYGDTCSNCVPALSFPNLSRVSMTFFEHEWTESFLSNLSAQLTFLAISHGIEDPDFEVAHRDPDDDSDPQQLSQGILNMLTPFTGLRELQLTGVCYDRWMGLAVFAMLSEHKTILTNTTALGRLCIETDQAWLGNANPLLSPAVPPTCSLSLTVAACMPPSDPRAVPWPEVFTSDSQRACLRDLVTNFSVRILDLKTELGPSLADLSLLTRMTKLVLYVGNVLHTQEAAEMQVLQGMTQLRRLHLGIVDLPADTASRSHTVLVPCLAALSSLTYLAIEGSGVIRAFAKFAEQGRLQAAWPTLRVLCFPGADTCSDSQCELKALVGAAFSHPSLQKMLLAIDSDDPSTCAFSLDKHARAAQLRMDLARAAAGGRAVVSFATQHDVGNELYMVRS